jgi:hypothetical protein
MEAARSPETSVSYHNTTHRYNPEGHDLKSEDDYTLEISGLGYKTVVIVN